MIASLCQIVLTVWLHAHTLKFTPSKIYTVDGCMAAAQNLAHRAKPGVRMTIECVATDKRDA
jgi:hypothetical protein